MSTIADRPNIAWHTKLTGKKTWFWYAPISDSHDLMIARIGTHWLMARLCTNLLPVGIPSQRLVLTWIGDCVCGHQLSSDETLKKNTAISCDHDLPFTYDLFRVTEFWNMHAHMHTGSRSQRPVIVHRYRTYMTSWFSRAALCISCSR